MKTAVLTGVSLISILVLMATTASMETLSAVGVFLIHIIIGFFWIPALIFLAFLTSAGIIMLFEKITKSKALTILLNKR